MLYNLTDNLHDPLYKKQLGILVAQKIVPKTKSNPDGVFRTLLRGDDRIRKIVNEGSETAVGPLPNVY